jgi:hypothetical protein
VGGCDRKPVHVLGVDREATVLGMAWVWTTSLTGVHPRRTNEHRGPRPGMARVPGFQAHFWGPAWRVRCGYRSSPSPDVRGYCDDSRRVIRISPGLTGNELDVMIVHESVHAVAGPGHARRFVARLRQAADAARDHSLATLAEALRTEADDYESTPPMRARDVYLEMEDAAWQGAPLGAVAAGLGLTLAHDVGVPGMPLRVDEVVLLIQPLVGGGDQGRKPLDKSGA